MLERDEQDKELSAGYFNSHEIPFEFLRSSNEVIPFLQTKEKTNLLPSVILLSMNSFPENGLTILKEIKTINSLKHIPIIILGENTEANLIKECYIYGVNTFINKPLTNSSTDFTVKNFIHYWFEIAQLPISTKEHVKS